MHFGHIMEFVLH